jgi:nitrogen regulatory protein PII
MSETHAPDAAEPAPRDLPAARLITCIVRSGKGQDVAEHLRRVLGVNSVVFHHARGLGIGTERQSGFHEEREVVEALVPAETADTTFAALYHFAELHRPHNGLIFMTRCRRGIPIQLPDLPEEE